MYCSHIFYKALTIPWSRSRYLKYHLILQTKLVIIFTTSCVQTKQIWTNLLH